MDDAFEAPAEKKLKIGEGSGGVVDVVGGDASSEPAGRGGGSRVVARHDGGTRSHGAISSGGAGGSNGGGSDPVVGEVEGVDLVVQPLHVEIEEMPYITKSNRPFVTMDELEQLGERPGPITCGLFLFHVTTRRYDMGGVWFALHVAKKLLSREFEFVVKQSSKIKVFIRPIGLSNNAILEGNSDVSFKILDNIVKIMKVHELRKKDRNKDILLRSPITSYPTAYDQLSLVRRAAMGYPTLFHSDWDNIDSYKHVEMSATVMSILGVSEGSPIGLVSVMFKYIGDPCHISHAIKAVPSDFPFKLAVDHDGSVFMKFANPSHAEALSRTHYFINGGMIKFYYVQSAIPKHISCDYSYLTLYSKAVTDDSFQIHV